MTKKTILVVEDEPSISDLLKYIFEREGYSVLVAADGEQAIKLARVKRPDIILLDIILPKLDGYSVNRQLQLEEKTANIPTIILTGNSEIQNMSELDKNVLVYLEKPFDFVILREKVAEVIKNG
ncbi:MAG: hypothetical protein A2474_08655 [Elusimicrobia bacterium RIFOXYC2_FULL_34_12]|nr:MAG: hypothetical protein A2474_08655 [Elusimicrobia bacterium RIFOXYC2_FULL_34_12]OGS37869.1 MAG: hypothetical protein A2551_08065 [Elusimicrobia bacterium RIFOXYD2_FULL_34_30]